MLSPYVVPGIDSEIKVMKPVFLDVCYNVIQEETGVTKEQIQSRIRQRPFVDAKKVISRVLRKYTRTTLEAIASEFNVDHSTIVHYTKTFSQLYDNEPYFTNLYDKVELSLIENQLI